MAVLIIGEHNGSVLNPSAANLAAAASAISSDVDVLVMCQSGEGIVSEAAKLSGIRKVLLAEGEQFSHPIAENVSAQVLQVAKDYSHILFAADSFGKAASPRVAAKLDVAQISEIIKVVSEDTFKRPIYAGAAIATVKSLDPVKVLTVRVTAFDPVGQEGTAFIEKIEAVPGTNKVVFLGAEKVESNRPELQSAKIVIAGGRGLANEAEFAEMEQLADKLKAAVGTTRAVVDAGMAPNDWQIGQTGKIIAPELYIGLGISGAIQHIAGIKDAKVIVAVNKDPEAPIFDVADYGLVADAMDVIRQLQIKL